MTTTSSIRGIRSTRAARIAPTTPAMVRSSLRAGITTLMRAPARRLPSTSTSAGQSRQCQVRRPYHACARLCTCYPLASPAPVERTAWQPHPARHCQADIFTLRQCRPGSAAPAVPAPAPRSTQTPGSDRVARGLGRELAPRRSGPPEGAAGELLHHPPGVLFEPMVEPTLRPTIAQARSPARFVGDVVLKVAANGGPPADRPRASGVPDLAQVACRIWLRWRSLTPGS